MTGPVMLVAVMRTNDMHPRHRHHGYYSNRHRDAASLLLMLACFVGLTSGAFFALVVDDVLLTAVAT